MTYLYDKSEPQAFQLGQGRLTLGPGTGFVDPRFGVDIENYPLPPHDNGAADFTKPFDFSELCEKCNGHQKRDNEQISLSLRTDVVLTDALNLTILALQLHF